MPSIVDGDDVGLRRRRRPDEGDSVTGRPQAGDHRVRQVERLDGAVGGPDGEVVEAVLDVRERHPPAVEEGEARLAEHPVREPDVEARARPSARRPTSGVQRYSVQKPVRSPLNHSEPSGAHVAWQIDSRVPSPATTVRVAAGVDDEPGGVPRHVGVVPLQPAERPSVGAPARIGHEVGPADDDLGRRRLAGGEAHDRVDRFGAVGRVGLLDAQQRRAVGRHVAVGVAQAPGDRRLRRQRHRLAAGTDAVEALRRPVGEPQHAVGHPPGAAAVLVHGGAGVPRCAEDLGRRRRRGPAAARRCAHPPRVGPPTTRSSAPSKVTSPGARAARTTSSLVTGVGHDPKGKTVRRGPSTSPWRTRHRRGRPTRPRVRRHQNRRMTRDPAGPPTAPASSTTTRSATRPTRRC